MLGISEMQGHRAGEKEIAGHGEDGIEKKQWQTRRNKGPRNRLWVTRPGAHLLNKHFPTVCLTPFMPWSDHGECPQLSFSVTV